MITGKIPYLSNKNKQKNIEIDDVCKQYEVNLNSQYLNLQINSSMRNRSLMPL